MTRSEADWAQLGEDLGYNEAIRQLLAETEADERVPEGYSLPFLGFSLPENLTEPLVIKIEPREEEVAGTNGHRQIALQDIDTDLCLIAETAPEGGVFLTLVRRAVNPLQSEHPDRAEFAEKYGVAPHDILFQIRVTPNDPNNDLYGTWNFTPEQRFHANKRVSQIDATNHQTNITHYFLRSNPQQLSVTEQLLTQGQRVQR